MAGEDRYDSAVAAEFERLWQELVLERTSAGVQAAVEAALAQIVAEAKAAALTGRKTGEALEAKIAALSEIDKRVGNLLDQAHRQQERVAEAARQADALSTSLGEAEAAMQRLAGGGERVDSIARRIAAIEASLGRTGLSDEIGKIIDDGRAHQADASETLAAIGRALDGTRAPVEPPEGHASEGANGSHAATATGEERGSWFARLRAFGRKWKHAIYGVLLGAVVTMVLVLVLDLPRTGLPPPSAKGSSAEQTSSGGDTEFGWQLLSRGERRAEFESFCANEECPFEAAWSSAGTDRAQAQLFTAIFKGADAGFGQASGNCPAIVGQLSPDIDFAALPRPVVELMGFCVVRQNFKDGDEFVARETAKALVVAYLAMLAQEPAAPAPDDSAASIEGTGDAEVAPKSPARSAAAKASTAAAKENAAATPAPAPDSAANPQ